MNRVLPPIETDLADALAAHSQGAEFLDVREAPEWADGRCPGAHLLALSAGLDAILQWARGRPGPIYVVCASGVRSLHVARALQASGIAATSVRGGMLDWRALGGPLESIGDRRAEEDRYLRHRLLPEVGESGQRRLQQSRIVLVGAGGLGSPAAFYLAAAGIGMLRLIDDDVVERSNLQRQILHRDDRIGVHKVESAAATLTALNPTVRVEAIAERLTAENALALFADCDLVIDGADNFPTRYLIDAVCRKLQKPWVYGAVHRFEGQVSVFDPRPDRGPAPCYRCLFPDPPHPGDAPNCALAGVLGVVPGIIGVIQANEAIKLVLGLGQTLVGRLLLFDALTMQFRELRYGVDPECPGCSAIESEASIPDPRKPLCASG